MGAFMSDNSVSPRPLHLQTIESLFAELIGGGIIATDVDGGFQLQNVDSRAALNWYRQNRPKWAGNVMTVDVEAIADCLDKPLPSLPVPPVATLNSKRRLRLAKVIAHRFAGIHAYGTPSDAPPDYTFEFLAPVTLFEGWNGAGKTSIINAITWCLTGEILRPQRLPESGNTDFNAYFTRTIDGKDEHTAHAISPVTPMPDGRDFIPERDKPIPADTWVELTFVDECDVELPPLRRVQSRTNKGKVSEVGPDFSALGVDPIALRIGTVMPAILPYIQLGDASDMGRAVAQLTGLADLANLTKQTTKATDKLSKEMKREREAEIATADGLFKQASSDLQAAILEFPAMKPADALPEPSVDKGVEASLLALETHFTNLKTDALRGAVAILGEAFNPSDKKSRDQLEAVIGPAEGQLAELKQLASARRLSSVAAITTENWSALDKLLVQMREEAAALAELRRTPELGRRKQLYARLSTWMEEGAHDPSTCGVCVRSLDGVTDPVTGRPISQHLSEIATENQEVLSSTSKAWVSKWRGILSDKSPEGLRETLGTDLPKSPVNLMRTALVDELFATSPFTSILFPLKNGMGSLCDEIFSALPEYSEPEVEPLPEELASDSASLIALLTRIERVRAFASWRHDHDAVIKSAFKSILQGDDPSAVIEDRSPLAIKLKALATIINGVEPLNRTLEFCKRMADQLKIRRAKEDRIKLYARTVTALQPVSQLGELAEAQVGMLQNFLHGRASHWRDTCYSNAYANAGHALRETAMDSKGVIEFHVGSKVARAPAQHISNASALRASLIGFFVAFWEHVLKTRGGLTILLLDDPQELLDGDNRQRLAGMLPKLVKEGAQLVVTSYDRSFTTNAVLEGRARCGIDHRSVHPVNAQRNCLETAPAKDKLDEKRNAFLQDRDNASNGQEYAGEVREFVEARMRDLFDDPSYPSYATTTKRRTFSDHLNQLRRLVKEAPVALFKSSAVMDFCNCPALAQDARCLHILNTAHHDKASLSAGDVNNVLDDLEKICRLAEAMHSAFRHWRWREPLEDAPNNVVQLKPLEKLTFSTLIHPDLAAFTMTSVHDENQDVAIDSLDGDWFVDKCLFYISTNNLGFSLPSGCIAIVETTPYSGKDHNIVIAMQKGNILARRLLLPVTGGDIVLAAETADPRVAKPTLSSDAQNVRLYRIVGMLLEQPPPPPGKGEARPLQNAASLALIKAAYRVSEESAVPLALPGQIVLGGECVHVNQFDALEGELVALSLMSGKSVFKRVGPSLPGALGHLRQFESIGGLGASLVVAMEAIDEEPDFPTFHSARRVVGVLYVSA
jgi:predicted ATPase